MALLRRIFESLDPSSSLTTDVWFLFKGESGIVKVVKAHKLILGGASDVFEREFFGPMKKDEDIEIKDVSEEVFRAMIDYIYNKKIELIDYDLNFLSSVYYSTKKTTKNNKSGLGKIRALRKTLDDFYVFLIKCLMISMLVYYVSFTEFIYSTHEFIYSTPLCP